MNYPVNPGFYGSAPQQAPQRDWGRMGTYIVLLGMAFAGALVYFMTSGGRSSGTAAFSAGNSSPSGERKRTAWAVGAETMPQAPSGRESAGAETTQDDEEPDDTMDSYDESPPGNTAGLIRANGEIDAPAGLVSMTVESEPAGASVVRKRDGARLGTTPYTYQTEAGSGKVSFVLELSGHRSTTVTMSSERDGVRQVMLLPGGGSATAARPQSKTKKRKVSSKRKQKRRGQRAGSKRSNKKKGTERSGGKVDYNADSIPF